MTDKQTGHCMCGAVEFSFEVAETDINACHCGQCRQWSGHLWASLNVPFNRFVLTKGNDALGWFRSSDYARRGFCKECGSSLFWHADRLDEHKDRIAIAAGTIDKTSALNLSEHIFVADKGDYYEIADGLPQKETY